MWYTSSMTTTIKPTGLALAGLGLDKEFLLTVARTLLSDVYWDEEREGEYRDDCRERGFAVEREIMKRSQTPQVPDETVALIKMAHICGRIEQAWGESFFSIARRICPPQRIQEKLLEDLIYYTLMSCIGHGIGPDEVAGFSDTGLSSSPIRIENPMQYQLEWLGSRE